MMRLIWATLWSSLAFADEAPLLARPVITADIRDEYLSGSPMIFQITARNPSDRPMTMPDLSTQFDRVKFIVGSTDGTTRTLSSRLDAPSSQQWYLPPGGQRAVLLELPNSRALPVGDHTLSIQIALEPDSALIGPETIRLALPAPLAADLHLPALYSERASDAIVWLHRGARGYDLYLSANGEHHLARLTEAVDPRLTAARVADIDRRHLVWMRGEKTVYHAQLNHHRLRRAPQPLTVPWPRAALATRGMTGPDGRLYQPLWIPAPRGEAGELQMLILSPDEPPRYRRIARLDRRPPILRALVDDSGGRHVLVIGEDAMDLYSITDDAVTDLPVAGKRLAANTQPIVDARFVFLKPINDHPGGLAILTVESASAGALTPRWRSMSGEFLQAAQPIAFDPTDVLLDISPTASGETVGILLRGVDGQVRYREGSRTQALPGLTGELALDRDTEGRAMILGLSSEGTTPSSPLVRRRLTFGE